MAYKAETPIGRKLEEFLLRQVNKIINLEQQLKIGEYEGTLTPDKPEWKKLNLSLKLSTKTLALIKQVTDGYQKKLDAIFLAIITAEAGSITKAGTAALGVAEIYIREKAKEQFDDLLRVVDEQGKEGYKAAKNSVRNSKKIIKRMNRAAKDRKEGKRRGAHGTVVSYQPGD